MFTNISWTFMTLVVIDIIFGQICFDQDVEEGCHLQFKLDYNMCGRNMTFDRSIEVYDGDPVFVSGSNLIILCSPLNCLADISLFLGEGKSLTSEPMRDAHMCLGRLAKSGHLHDTLKKTYHRVRPERLILPFRGVREAPYLSEKIVVESETKRFLNSKRSYRLNRAVLIALVLLLGLILMLQYYLLIYLMRMRRTHVLVSRSAVFEEVGEKTTTTTNANSTLSTGTLRKSIIGASTSASKSFVRPSVVEKPYEDAGNSLDDNVPSELKSKKALSELQSRLM
ncbi:hypothetical protein V3C99_006314 [Haemonchus contortus]